MLIFETGRLALKRPGKRKSKSEATSGAPLTLTSDADLQVQQPDEVLSRVLQRLPFRGTRVSVRQWRRRIQASKASHPGDTSR